MDMLRRLINYRIIIMLLLLLTNSLGLFCLGLSFLSLENGFKKSNVLGFLKTSKVLGFRKPEKPQKSII